MSDASQAEQALFLDCLELDASGRALRLAAAEPALARRVERLLAAHDEAAARGMTLGAALPPDEPAPELPAMIGPYRVLEALGEGGMGEVFLAAQDEPVRRVVAIKLLKPWLAGSGIAARFQAERQAMALMSHPAIARILDAGRSGDGRPYFVMEYLPGLPITRYCAEHRLDLRARLALLHEVCGAVQHAHYKGVIHRDLKPSNILVTDIDGEPAARVIDFGIAKVLQGPEAAADPQFTRAGLVIGTPDYMSPEQAGAGGIDVDTRTDVWSLGAVMHELLTGVAPFAGVGAPRSLTESLPRPSRRLLLEPGAGAHAKGCSLQDVAELTACLEDELDWICLKALAPERTSRYASADELAADLQRHLAGETVTARPPTLRYRMRKYVQRHRVVSAVAATALAALLAFVALVSNHARELRIERDRASQEAALARQVTQFTAGLFERASPSSSGGGAVTARELLSAATRQLRLEDRNESPPLRAALLESVANAYTGLGLYDDAEPLLVEALTLRRADTPPAADALGAALVSLNRLERGQGDFAAAAAAGREALALLEPALGRDAPEVVKARLELAETLRRLGELDEALRLAEAALESVQRRNDLNGEEHALALYTLGRIHTAAGALDEAVVLLERAVEQWQSLHGEFSIQVLDAKNGLANTVLLLDDLARGEALMREVVSTYQVIFGEQHQETAIALSNLGNALSDQPEKFDEAEAAYRRSAEILRTRLGPRTPETATVLNNLGALLLKTGDWQGADEAYRECIGIRLAVLGADHADTAAAQMGRALALNRLERYEDAHGLMESAIAVFAAGLGPDHWRTANARRYLGTVLTNLGRYDEARAELDRARADLAAALGPTHSRTLSADQALSELATARAQSRRAAAR